MVVKGEIQTINFASNNCSIRLPFFESSSGDSVIVTATFSNTPGNYNGYKEGDIVFVAFENGELNQAVIVGKLYLGAAEETKDNRGSISCQDLRVLSNATLPLNTKLTYSVEQTVADNAAGRAKFNTIADIIAAIQQLNGSPSTAPRTAIIRDAVTNLYGYTMSEFKATLTADNSRYIITYNDQEIVPEEQCLKYMKYMMGVDAFPYQVHGAVFNEAFSFTDGRVGYPEYINKKLSIHMVTALNNSESSNETIQLIDTTTHIITQSDSSQTTDTFSGLTTIAGIDIIDTTK